MCEYEYEVRTQHFDDEFVCPRRIKASSALGAARKRFGQQALASRRNTTAVLVIDGPRAYVYPVLTTPRVSGRALTAQENHVSD